MTRGLLFAAVLLAATARPGSAQGTIDVSRAGYDRGSADAPITVVEFADFACSACGLFARETLPAIHRDWIATGRVRIKYVPFILGIFPRAMEAAEAAECAGEQNAFWSMHDVLYSMQRDWTRLGDPRDRFLDYARRLSLDIPRFAACLDADRHRATIEDNTRIAQRLQIRGTPTFFVNGARIQGAIPLAQMEAMLRAIDPQR